MSGGIGGVACSKKLSENSGDRSGHSICEACFAGLPSRWQQFSVPLGSNTIAMMWYGSYGMGGWMLVYNILILVVLILLAAYLYQKVLVKKK